MGEVRDAVLHIVAVALLGFVLVGTTNSSTRLDLGGIGHLRDDDVCLFLFFVYGAWALLKLKRALTGDRPEREVLLQWMESLVAACITLVILWALELTGYFNYFCLRLVRFVDQPIAEMIVCCLTYTGSIVLLGYSGWYEEPQREGERGGRAQSRGRPARD
eukprot:Hpha_TRINITY_DN15821_c4_g5::TRINITY_DN15821_c4_g5_i1::g.188619::m.188619